MKIKRKIPNVFGIIKLEGGEDDIYSKTDLMQLDWTKDKEIFYKDGPNLDYLMTVNRCDDTYFGTVIGYIFGSGKELGLEEYDRHVGLLKLKNKLKN